jgi:hypothetical protein
VREQVALYESSGGTKGTTLRDTGLPVIIVTNTGNKTGGIRKTPLMRVAFPPYAEYQAKTTRKIPLFVAEPKR